MTIADITLGVFTLFNGVRFLAYLPQIARAMKDRNGAEAISFGTWTLFLLSHTSAMAYAVENQGDLTMATLFLGNALGSGAVLLIAVWKRSRHRQPSRSPAASAKTCPLTSPTANINNSMAALHSSIRAIWCLR